MDVERQVSRETLRVGDMQVQGLVKVVDGALLVQSSSPFDDGF